MLALRNSSHSRVVAFIVVLAMVLMYTLSFAPIAYAAGNGVIVHAGSNELDIQVNVTLGGILYSATPTNSGGSSTYKGNFTSGSLPEQPIADNVSVIVDGATVKGFRIGVKANGTLNIWLQSGSAPGNDPAFDIEVTKTVDQNEVYAGETVNFEIVVKNYGPDVSTQVTLIDILPNGLTFVSSDSNDYTSSTGIWTVGAIAADAQKILKITAIVDEAVSDGTVLENVATLTSGDTGDEADNSDKATVTVKTPRPINLWVSADDDSVVYINGDPVTSADPANVHWGYVQEYSVDDLGDSPFVAAKGLDYLNVIAGFKLVLLRNDSTYLVTNDEWYYYTGEGEPGLDHNDNNWYEENYFGNEWSPVKSDLDVHSNWVTGGFPTDGALWIWSPNYRHPVSYAGVTEFDKIVHLRSMAPTQTPTTGSITIKKEVLTSNRNPVNDTVGEFTFTITKVEEMTSRVAEEQLIQQSIPQFPITFTLKDGETWKSDLPFGTYTVTEAENEDYTQETTETSISIDLESLKGEFTFVNLQKPGESGGGGDGDGGGTTTTDITPEPTPTSPILPSPAPEIIVIPEEAPALADAPQTGDNSNVALLMVMMLLSGAGLVAVTRRRKATDNVTK